MGPHLQAIVRAVPTLRPLRLGDGALGRFHGGGAGSAQRIDQALAELRLIAQPKPRLPMGYARLQGGRVALLLDGAPPPADPTRAHAGTLAFEMSGGPRAADRQRRAGRGLRPGLGARRAPTAAHSTVEVDGGSSARFVTSGLAARTFGPRLASGPEHVSVRQAQDAGGQWLLATHDGYVSLPRPPARAPALRRRPRPRAARRGHPDRRRRPRPRPVRAARQPRPARLRGALPPAPGGAARARPRAGRSCC